MDTIDNESKLPVLALSPDDMTLVFRVSRTRVFEEIRAGKLRAKKAGKLTLIDLEEGKRWFRSLPDREPGEAP